MKSTESNAPSTKPRQALRAAYTLAAGAAAGAAASPADAAVVYSGPQNISIAQFASQQIDLNSDGFNDIKLKNYIFGGNYQGATVNYFPGKLVSFNPGPRPYATALGGGVLIDGTTPAASFYGSMAYGAANPNAQFNSAVGKFLGLSFPAGSNNYFGWVRVDVNNAAGTFNVRDWAYESVPGTGITTPVPEPATLGLLAAGAAGLAALRRKRTVQA